MERQGWPERFKDILPGEGVVRGLFKAVPTFLPRVTLAPHGDHLPSYLPEPATTGAEHMLSNPDQMVLDLDGQSS